MCQNLTDFKSETKDMDFPKITTKLLKPVPPHGLSYRKIVETEAKLSTHNFAITMPKSQPLSKQTKKPKAVQKASKNSKAVPRDTAPKIPKNRSPLKRKTKQQGPPSKKRR